MEPQDDPQERARHVAARLAALRDRVARAATAAGRPVDDVRVLLASKTMDAVTVRAALAADAAARAAGSGTAPVLLGENRVQELVAKAPVLADAAPVWHVIGPLQSNKVNAALRWAAAVQSVADDDLALRLSARVRERDVPLDVWVQVNVSGEPTKHGARPQDARDLAARVAALPGLRLAGFMTVGARGPDEDRVRAGYALLRAVRDDVVASGAPGTGDARGLSMGMSGDLELAVAEGASVVRIGTAVFGSRPATGGEPPGGGTPAR
ncbi:YggS family pyridoxal phosphate-dependent enzyme [Cellulomonas shaoxiangyii]|uniref:Pyridoxal phosphate homeostasis protein n=1 Tax=Cellulomonas shaoxiangyii TaxID=2566013 RepID=A0A4P7SJB0_9CELL|nr:YggS family pyridoxal phosphate-dependent enzyme [Cellulomonas shaoxiangyii]QCB94202.1 YggS family pyridoxal phosphate-dependent enzyme [Cellulomonas shaoxiangyii]TGY86695.1 YggS family pyridoxal phosphate-dependent enzyme [Cellulomonas shaoxiangyii]